MPIKYQQCADGEAAAEAVCELILQRATVAIARRGRFVLALSGGDTPRRVYQRLADARQDWKSWHLVYGDERCLPDGDSRRTSVMVERNWLSRIRFPADNHYVPPVELGADAAALDYAAAIEPLLPLDLALLGVGEDGHTASLFPGQIHPEQIVVPVHNAPKPPAERISLSYATLCASDTVCFLVTGPAKRVVMRSWLAGANLPVARIAGRGGTVLITDIPR